MKILLLIFAALVVAGGTGFFLLEGLKPPAPVVQAEAPAAPKPKEVFVPAIELTVGAIILPEHLGRMPIAESAIRPEMIVADEAGEAVLVGSVARQILPQGVPIARSATVQPGDRGFLAAVLPQGKRAISIPISEVAGLSGLVLPGDRVDIILTYLVSGDVIESTRDIRASETVVSNLRVLALDQRLGPVKPLPEQDGQPLIPPVPRTATLEVSPEEAELITLATTLGDLSLVLNSVRDGGEPVVLADAERALEDISMPSGIARDTGGRMLEIRPRHMTIDSEVTSLLLREIPAAPDTVLTESAVPVADRTTQVQIVRGTETRAVELAAEAAAAATIDTTAPAAAAAPATE